MDKIKSEIKDGFLLVMDAFVVLGANWLLVFLITAAITQSFSKSLNVTDGYGACLLVVFLMVLSSYIGSVLLMAGDTLFESMKKSTNKH